MRVPLVDLLRQHRMIADDLDAALARLFDRADFIGGEAVGRFEDAFAETLGVHACVAVANGTDAIELALRASEIGVGDEVVLPANTFIATALACVRAGATPVFCDVDEVYGLIDPAAALERCSSRARAVIPVHLYGQMAPVEGLVDACSARGITVIEDAAQAHGATRSGRPPGVGTSFATYSFYPAKNLGAYGDGGAITMDSSERASLLRALRNYGGEARYEHRTIGFNSRLDTVQALILLLKLPHLAGWNEQRRRAAALYDEMLAGVAGVTRPHVMSGNEHVWHLYVVRVAERDTVLDRLHGCGIGAAIHYPKPLHLTEAFSGLGYRQGEFPVAERAAQQILSLPLFPGITEEEQSLVVSALRDAVDGRG